jgi:hypothetical protein
MNFSSEQQLRYQSTFPTEVWLIPKLPISGVILVCPCSYPSSFIFLFVIRFNLFAKKPMESKAEKPYNQRVASSLLCRGQ